MLVDWWSGCAITENYSHQNAEQLLYMFSSHDSVEWMHERYILGHNSAL